MNAETYLRVGFSGLLHCLSPMHVGDGDDAFAKDRPANDRKPLTEGRYNTVCTDHRNKPYIPGSTLRGALSAMLSANNPPLADILLGNQDRAGKLRVEAAYLTDTHREPLELPYWDDERRTYLHRGVRIEPVTRTADAGAHGLFLHELVAPGATFRWQVWLEQPSPEMVALVRDTLEEWQCRWDHAIGSGRGKGWGLVRCELQRIETLSGADLSEWLNQDNDELPYRIQDFTPRDSALLPDSDEVRLTLLPRTAFLVNEDYFTGRNGADPNAGADLAFQRTADRHALIPGSSLKGWLRARAHKIAATIAHQYLGVSAERARSLVEPLIQSLFGKEQCRGQLWIGDAISDKPAGIVTFMMNAIDRFTGGVSISDSPHLRHNLEAISALEPRKRGGALFQAEAAECDRLDGTIYWDKRHAPLPDDAQKGLLLLIARDVLEGELRLGWGQAKGFGEMAARLRIQGSDIIDWEGLLTALRQIFGAEAPEVWVDALHRALLPPHPDPLPQGGEGKGAELLSEIATTPGNNGGGQFISPYQFLPVTGKLNSQPRADIDYRTVENGRHPFIRHDLWHRDGHSGRIVCRVHLNTPTFVGNDQIRADQSNGLAEDVPRTPTRVNHFQLDEQPAFPANSLRGMVGTVLEALSQSALRVLDNIDYSVRQDASAGNQVRLGRITPDSEPGRMKLREYDYCHVPTATAWRVFEQLTRPEKCYADLTQRHPKKSGRGADELHGAALNHVPSDSHSTEGCLLILDAPGDKLPEGRKFELFAYPGNSAGKQPLQVREQAVAIYEELFAERWLATASKDDEPKQPFGFRGFDRDAKQPWRLLPGQFVYFRAVGNDVVELRPSQIWRSKAGTTFDYFAGINPNLLPWGAAARAGGLSPAETILGVVERDKDDGAKGSRNLGGRVRFSHGRYLGAEGVKQLPEVKLKIQSSPKPPSPAMYFHPKDRRGDYLARTDLIDHASNPKSNNTSPPPTPNGRKVYVHHRLQDIERQQPIRQEPWRSQTNENDHQKRSVAPLEAGQDFFFHLDFDNLSRDELDLLLTAIKPTPEHRHRLGLGKSLGLGSVSLDIAAVCLRDTAGRYTVEGLNEHRYRTAWREHQNDVWRQRYPLEWQVCESSGERIGRPTEWRATANPLIDTATRELVALLGDPEQVELPVLPPLLRSQMGTLAERETETFKWFVENNSTDNKRPAESHQALGRLQAGEPLPGLEHDPPGVELPQ